MGARARYSGKGQRTRAWTAHVNVRLRRTARIYAARCPQPCVSRQPMCRPRTRTRRVPPPFILPYNVPRVFYQARADSGAKKSPSSAPRRSTSQSWSVGTDSLEGSQVDQAGVAVLTIDALRLSTLQQVPFNVIPDDILSVISNGTLR
jgi:hypothetical protein